MKSIILFLAFCIFGDLLAAQPDIEITGNAKLSNLLVDNTIDKLLVMRPDGTMALREVNTLYNTINLPGINGSTIRHDGTNWQTSDFLHNGETKIGIGTQNPKYTLDVQGNLRFGAAPIDRGGNDRRYDVSLVTNAHHVVYRLMFDGVDSGNIGNLYLGTDGPSMITRGSYNNIGIGGDALNNMSVGYNNIGVGHASQVSTTEGQMNVAVGVSTLFFNTTGNQNVAVGSHAGYKTKGSNNVFIGYQAGLNEEGSNRLYIESMPAAASPLIYGEFDNDMLQVNGSLHITDFARLKPGKAPATPEEGTVYYDATTKKLRVWVGNKWDDLN